MDCNLPKKDRCECEEKKLASGAAKNWQKRSVLFFKIRIIKSSKLRYEPKSNSAPGNLVFRRRKSGKILCRQSKSWTWRPKRNGIRLLYPRVNASEWLSRL